MAKLTQALLSMTNANAQANTKVHQESGEPTLNYESAGEGKELPRNNNKNILTELIRKKKNLQRKLAGQDQGGSRNTTFSQAASFASLGQIYGTISKYNGVGEGGSFGQSASQTKVSYQNVGSPPAAASKKSRLGREISPGKAVGGNLMGLRTPASKINSPPSRPADEEKLLEGQIDELSTKIEELSKGGNLSELDLHDLLAKNLDLYHFLLEKYDVTSSLLEKLRANQDRLNAIVRGQAAALKYLEEENGNLSRDKMSLGQQVSKLKAKVLELAEIKQHQEGKITELEARIDMQKNKKTLGFNIRNLLDENDELKQALREQDKSLNYMKSKEIKLIKLLYFVKKEGIDIDGIYQKYADDIQNNEDESQFITEGSIIEGEEAQPQHDHKSAESQDKPPGLTQSAVITSMKEAVPEK
eukprot:TRINITY_DN12834_c0_g2_i2.p1 TRINITY_DN12834_c0_g2~~TRINITY_DN12834_c0_g2_i2.p1  ORF type:complete len:416 (+),score=107.79 TRINITY_DN12834_c0_g2_i2:282-1529(+)